MIENLATAQDAEDAFYDAIEERDAERLRAVWEDSEDIACLLPMQRMLHGAEVHQAFEPLLEAGTALEIRIRHIRWLEAGDIAVHFVEERVGVPGGPPPPAVYASNVFRKGDSGWRLLIHQNSPTPPPPGSMPPGAARGTPPS